MTVKELIIFLLDKPMDMHIATWDNDELADLDFDVVQATPPDKEEDEDILIIY